MQMRMSSPPGTFWKARSLARRGGGAGAVSNDSPSTGGNDAVMIAPHEAASSSSRASREKSCCLSLKRIVRFGDGGRASSPPCPTGGDHSRSQASKTGRLRAYGSYR
eukprot:scaffold552_cov526-Prasinococcus_capsulatus_cf.AAC.9